MNNQQNTPLSQPQPPLTFSSDTYPLSTTILENAPVGYAILDTELRFQYVNQLLADINQRPSDQHVGHKITKINPEVDQKALQNMKTVLRNGTPLLDSQKKGVVVESNSGTWLESYYPIKSDGQTIGIGVIITDASERAQMERLLEESKEQLFIALKNSPITATRVNKDLQHTWVQNPPFDLTKEEMIGRRFDELLPEKEAEKLITIQRKVIADGIPRKREIALETGESASFFEIRCEPLYDKHGKIEGATTELIDITEHKKIEELQSHITAIVESSSDAIIGKTLNGVITSWNSGAEEMYGYSKSEALGRSVDIIVPEEREEEHSRMLKKIEKGGTITDLETKRMCKDGIVKDISLTASPIKDGDGNIVGASTIARDISRRKDLENKKEAFMSMTSHELKTPITTLRLYNDLLKSKCVGDDDELHLFVTKISRQINRLDSLISELLDVSKIRTNTFSTEKRETDLSTIVKNVVDDLKETFHHTIHLELEKEHIPVHGDKQRLSQVVDHFISNAAKYSPEQNKIDVAVYTQKNTVVCSVKDYGIGIPKRYHKDVFTPFFRVIRNPDKTFPGLGVGLHISKEIIERHGGRVWVESERGKGSTFYFSLPLLT